MPRLTKRVIDSLASSDAEAFVWDSDVRGFGVRVKPSGTKSFVLKYRVGNATRRFTIGKVGSPYTVDEARARAAELLRDVKAGLDPQAAKVDARKAPTVAELADVYLDEGPAHKPNKKASSWVHDRSVLTRHVKPLLGRKVARDLTRADIARFQADVAAGKSAVVEKTKARGKAIVRGGHRAASMATVILKATLQFAVETGRLSANPAKGVSLYKSERRERFLCDREVAFIAQAVNELESEGRIGSALADAIRVLMLSGCRKSEVLGLRWSWVDFERQALRLPDSKVGARSVPIASAALQIIDRRRGGSSEFVFPAAYGDGPAVGLQRAWDHVRGRATSLAVKAAEQGGHVAYNLSNVRLHDLRHSFASFAVANGSSLFLLGKVLGHRQTSTTELYSHVNADPVLAVAERTAAKIADAMAASHRPVSAPTPLKRRMKHG
ncbi:site-specific integrase [Brevundimonas sp.]|uniref:tyrosine-type recombinase/integrase n=1 Tax=Brevundimonas sp. TaxID=1871086 RepID=UPI0025FFA036|nr:site-specific integrase [Brevundimonas sp.]